MKIIEKRADGSIRVATKFVRPSRVKQSHKDSTDVNKILKKYSVGEQNSLLQWNSKFGDGVVDYSSRDFARSMDVVVKARESFEALPSHVRDRFGNNPQSFVSFMEKKENLEESYRLGLRVRSKVAAADPAPVPGKVPKPKPKASDSEE